ncbi:unnamed protein product [Prorocentrum cordatum]|uniref:Secreted protein n=1 Tax=Prorocentrum cordatum TaxID=2364126 RepID=A0ABN9RTM2_9DINO|nr:unnamed protein product [Polarella glacialis]
MFFPFSLIAVVMLIDMWALATESSPSCASSPRRGCIRLSLASARQTLSFGGFSVLAEPGPRKADAVFGGMELCGILVESIPRNLSIFFSGTGVCNNGEGLSWYVCILLFISVYFSSVSGIVV